MNREASPLPSIRVGPLSEDDIFEAAQVTREAMKATIVKKITIEEVHEGKKVVREANIELPDHKTRMAAAREVMDRVNGKSVTTTIITDNTESKQLTKESITKMIAEDPDTAQRMLSNYIASLKVIELKDVPAHTLCDK